MSDKQLAVLLKRYMDLITEAKEKIESLLPDGLKTEYKNFIGQKVEGYSQTEVLDDVYDKISKDVELLSGK